MYTQEQLTAQKDNLNKLVEEILSIEVNDLIRSELGIELNFADGLYSFTCIRKLISEFKVVNKELLSYQQAIDINAQFNSIKNTYKKILEFSLTKHPTNTTQQRQAYLEEIISKANALFNILQPIITYYSRSENYEISAASIVNNLKELSSSVIEKMKTTQNEIEDTLKNVRSATAEVGVSQHSIHFAQTSGEHKKYSRYWLLSTVGIMLVSLAISSTFLYNLYLLLDNTSNQASTPNTLYTVQYGVAKLVILSILYYLIIWSNKNYKAHRHCCVVNEHRQNALSTFEAFVKSTDDSQTKNAVLIQASSCIFTPQHTGYLSFETETTSNPTILEVIRSVVQEKK